jgi:hypothetical protein
MIRPLRTSDRHVERYSRHTSTNFCKVPTINTEKYGVFTRTVYQPEIRLGAHSAAALFIGLLIKEPEDITSVHSKFFRLNAIGVRNRCHGHYNR